MHSILVHFGFNELASQSKIPTKKGAATVTEGANAVTQFSECPFFWTLKFGVMGNTPSSPKLRIPWMGLPRPEALKEAAGNVTGAPIRTAYFQIPSQALEWQGMHQILLVSELNRNSQTSKVMHTSESSRKQRMWYWALIWAVIWQVANAATQIWQRPFSESLNQGIHPTLLNSEFRESSFPDQNYSQKLLQLFQRRQLGNPKFDNTQFRKLSNLEWQRIQSNFPIELFRQESCCKVKNPPK